MKKKNLSIITSNSFFFKSRNLIFEILFANDAKRNSRLEISFTNIYEFARLDRQTKIKKLSKQISTLSKHITIRYSTQTLLLIHLRKQIFDYNNILLSKIQLMRSSKITSLLKSIKNPIMSLLTSNSQYQLLIANFFASKHSLLL